ncbi:MAG: winged helix-turn-helix domain-containing protein [Rhodospirillaceae bacterium]|nr:winged helix-turn-helix domain-containing protein [Rhodospirillaceae bacterium]
MSTPLTLERRTARRLFLSLQGLSDNPNRRMRSDELYALIERMGFVQLDSIITIERAHHLTLFSRNQTYRRRDFDRLLEKDRRLFEHWTHDASVIPIQWFGHWSHRFERMANKQSNSAWFAERIGPDADKIIAGVLEHVRANGPTMSRDLEDAEGTRAGPWWGWGPTKAALEHLWWSGQLSVVRRKNFQKVYDLTERVIPTHHRDDLPDRDAHIEWACTTALDRLGVATSGEIAAFWAAISPAEAKAWVEANAHRLQDVLVEQPDGAKPRPSVAWPHLEDQLAGVPEPPSRLRFLSPFDPVVRDRNRALRLFDFDYRFEAFVPAPKRRYGYCVLPMLEGDRIVGRACMKFHRDRGCLTVNNLWWEPKVKPGKGRIDALSSELERLRRFLGAETITVTKGL